MNPFNFNFNPAHIPVPFNPHSTPNPPNSLNPNPTNPANPYTAYGFQPFQISGGEPQPALDSNAVTWTRPNHSQAQSRLVSLPVELKSMILQKVLTADHPIYERTDQPGQVPYTYDAAGRTRDYQGRFIRPTGMPLAIGHGLTPAVLQTCQTLLANGRSELYDRNVLQVDFYVGDCPGPKPTQEDICSDYLPGCTRCAIVTTIDDEILLQRDHEGNWQYDQNMQQIVSRFKKINFTMRVARSVAAYENARTLILYWAQTADMAKMELSVEVLSPRQQSPGTVHTDLLQLFRLLRCAKFTFSNGPALDPMHRGIEREVLSSLPILNFDRSWGTIQPIIQQLLTETTQVNDIYLHNLVRRFSDQLRRARVEFHPANFQQAHNRIITIYRLMTTNLVQVAQNHLNETHVIVAARTQELARTGRTDQDYQ